MGKPNQPGIVSHSEICGGEPCIARTRIPVWVLVQSHRLGLSDAEILRCYPTLRAGDLENVWSYARQHAEEIDCQIRENEADWDMVHAICQRFEASGRQFSDSVELLGEDRNR